jgi:hypothetical protein
MNVTEAARPPTRVELPADAARPFEVYVNGVAQREGVEFRVVGRTLVFDRELRGEGRLGFWRWASMVIGAAGTYRQNDSVDVVYERAGRRHVEAGLRFEASVDS